MHSATYASIDTLQATAYVVPTDGPEGDGPLTWDSTTIVVCEIGAGDVTGLGYTYAHESCVALMHDKLASVVRAAQRWTCRRLGCHAAQRARDRVDPGAPIREEKTASSAHPGMHIQVKSPRGPTTTPRSPSARRLYSRST
jgi:hypothetical protein